MAVTLTPRDQLGRLVDFVKKAFKYWWLVPAFVLIGALLSTAFALRRKATYQTWAVLFYQEKITSSVFTGRQQEVQRNIGDRYRELLLAHDQLKQIVNDPKLNPHPKLLADDGEEAVIDELRKSIKFEAKGMSAFRIVYTDQSRERARDVAAKLTELLQNAEDKMRRTAAMATAEFATKQKEAAADELRKREVALAQFLTQHPEFVQDASGTVTEGAGIRSKLKDPAPTSGNPKLVALERQRARLQARLDAKPDAAPVVINRKREPTPEQVAALEVVAEAEREYKSAQRDLEAAQAKFTEKHPTVVQAKDDVAVALQRLRRAQAAVPPDEDVPLVAPATPQDRERLQRELATLDSMISDLRSASPAAKPSNEKATNAIVEIETEHAKLRRAVMEQREVVENLSDSEFRAQIEASQQLAEAGTRLTVVDPAFKPLRPQGKPKTFIVIAGVMLFFAMGFGIALLLALIDDRLYRRTDIEALDLLPVLSVIPPTPGRKRWFFKRGVS